MSDLISRSELAAAIKRQYCTGCDNYNGSRCRACHADDMLSMVDDAVAAGPRWVSVEEKLPEDGDDVAAIIRWDENVWEYGIAFRCNGKWLVNGEGVVTVTHWQPLPALPTEG